MRSLQLLSAFAAEPSNSLHVVRSEACLFTCVFVGGVVESRLAVDYLGWVVRPAVVRDMLRGLTELLKRLIENGTVVLVDVELDFEGF